MNLRRLQMLLYLRELGTVTATAEALQLSVPAVSQQLHVLERDVSMALVERAGRRLALTREGEVLAGHAEVILAGVTAAEADIARLRGGGLGRITIASFASAARTLLPSVWAELCDVDAMPLELSVNEQEPEAALPALSRREADVAIVHSYTLLPRDLPAGADARHLAHDPLLLALPPATATRLELTPNTPVDLADLADATGWVAPAPDSSCREVMRRACGEAGFVPAVRATAGDFSVLAGLVAAGAGAALLPRLALIGQAADVALFPLRQPVSRTISAVTRLGDGDRPDIAAVLACLDRAATSLERCEPASGLSAPSSQPERSGDAHG